MRPLFWKFLHILLLSVCIACFFLYKTYIFMFSLKTKKQKTKYLSQGLEQSKNTQYIHHYYYYAYFGTVSIFFHCYLK